jgi:hypothetical protein
MRAMPGKTRGFPNFTLGGLRLVCGQSAFSNCLCLSPHKAQGEIWKPSQPWDSWLVHYIGVKLVYKKKVV